MSGDPGPLPPLTPPSPHRPSGTRVAVARALVAAGLFGVSTPVAKVLLDGVPATTLAGLLYLGAGLGLAPLVARSAASGGRLLPADGRNRGRLLGAALLGGGVAPVLVLVALARSQAASVSIWLNLETVATALLGVTIFREHLGRLAAVGNALVFAAGFALAFDGGLGTLVPGLLIAAAALCWGVDNHLTATIDGVRPEQSTFFKGILAGSVNLALGLALHGAEGLSAGRVAGSLALGALSYGASIVLYIEAAQALGATRAQMLFASAPFFGVVGAIVGLGEGLSALQGLALGLLVGGNALLARERHEHGHHHHPMEHEHEHRHDDGHHDHVHGGEDGGAAHTHRHRHAAAEHVHPHLPDLHHRHGHEHD